MIHFDYPDGFAHSFFSEHLAESCERRFPSRTSFHIKKFNLHRLNENEHLCRCFQKRSRRRWPESPNGRETMPSVGIHPDQKLAAGPGEQVHWDQTKSL